MAQDGGGGQPFEVPGYRDVSRIGSGASSTVYKGYDPELSRWVAIKVLLGDDPDDPARRRFKREGEITANLGKHPHIVQVLGTGFTAFGSPYVVMELFEQGSIGDRLRTSGAFTVEETLDIGEKIADAVAAAHRAGVLHRDIKPQNILLSEYGPALGDFGIARTSANLEWSQSLDQLTPMHAAPEILLGGTSTSQSDLYSLGSTLYAMLAGRPPFAGSPGEAPLRYQARVLQDPVPPIPRADLSPSVVEALERTLAKNPADRHRSATELRDVLRACQRQTADSPSHPPPGTSPGSSGTSAPEPIGHFLAPRPAAPAPPTGTPLPATPPPATAPPLADDTATRTPPEVHPAPPPAQPPLAQPPPADDTITRTPRDADPATGTIIRTPRQPGPWDPPPPAPSGKPRLGPLEVPTEPASPAVQEVRTEPVSPAALGTSPGPPSSADDGGPGDGELTVQRPISTLEPARAPAATHKPAGRRRRAALVGAAGAVVVGGVVAAVLLTGSSTPPKVPIKGIETITTTDTDRPTDVSLVSAGTGATLQWSDPAAGNSEYLVYEIPATGAARIVGVTTGGTTSFNLPGIDPSSTQDCFQVRAKIGPDTVGAPAHWCPTGETLSGS